jgi:polar amino acid transport system substrate-binding protein/glutamate/aspartate transport system substrate-binding protein
MRFKLLSLAAAACLALPMAVQAQTLDRIKETGLLKIGFRTDTAPLSFLNDAGQPAGYAPILCGGVAQAIANQLKMDNLEARFFPVDAENRFDKIISGEIDLLCGAATITLRRQAVVDFSLPIYVDGTAFMVLKGKESKFEQLGDKKLGVREGTTTQEAVTNTLKAANASGTLVTFQNHADGFAALEAGEVDAYFADQSILLGMLAKSGKDGPFEVSGEILTIEKQGLAMTRGDSDFRLLVDTALSKMYADGTVEDVFRQSLPGATPGIAFSALFMIAPTLP